MPLEKVKNLFSRIFAKQLVKDSAWIFSGQIFNIFLSVVYFIILARTLGSGDYGNFLAVTSLAGLLHPFSGLGSENLIIRSVSRDRGLLGLAWGNALFLIAVSSLPLTLLGGIISSLFLPKEITAVIYISIFLAETIGLKVVISSSGAFYASGHVKQSIVVNLIMSALKLLGAIAFTVFFTASGIVGWSLLYCAANIAAALIAGTMVNYFLDPPKLSLNRIHAELKDGIFFSISASSDRINGNLDKTMMASLSTSEAAGVYGAGYRFIEMGYMPILAVMSAAYSRMFKHGSEGIEGSWQFAKRLLPAGVLYGTLSTIGFLLIAPVVPLVLGSEYQESVPVLRWLAPVHLLAALQLIVADSLTGAGLQPWRSGVQVISSLLNFLANLWLIPILSWRGAAAATLFTEVFKLVALCFLLFIFLRKKK